MYIDLKKIFFALIAIVAIDGCSIDIDIAGDRNIVLSAISTITSTKDSIATNDVFTAGIAGWESASSADYTAIETWKTSSTVTAATTATAITLATAQTYNADNTIKTFMKAWYPEGKLSSGVVSFTNTTGDIDAMIARGIYGSVYDRSRKIFEFVHKTTQLKFLVVKGKGLAEGTTLTSIKVKNVQLPTGFNLSDETVNYSPATDLMVPGITAGSLTIGSTPAGDIAGNPVMISPIYGNTISLDIVTNHATYPGITVTIDSDATFVAGRAYTIILTFTQRGVDLTAPVVEWTAGTGSAIIE